MCQTEPHVPDFPLESPEDSAHHRLKAEHDGLAAAVQRERDTLSALVESITDEIWFADADGSVTLVNPAVWKEFGALGGEPVEAIAARFEVLRADGTSRPPIEAPHLRALHGEVIRDEEEIVRTLATGELRHRLVSGAPVRGRDGAIIGSVCVVRDVTHRVRAEEALRASEERLRLATAAARIGAFDWNVQTGVNRWTEELEAMYGLAPGEFGKTQPAWEHLVHPDDRAPAVALVDGALETGQPVEGEWRVVWPDGSVHWIAGRFQAFKDDGGRPLRLTGVNIDITRQKAVEEELRRSRKDLDRAQAVGAGRELAPGRSRERPDLVGRERPHLRAARRHPAFLRYLHVGRAPRGPRLRRCAMASGPARRALRHRAPSARRRAGQVGAREGVP